MMMVSFNIEAMLMYMPRVCGVPARTSMPRQSFVTHAKVAGPVRGSRRPRYREAIHNVQKNGARGALLPFWRLRVACEVGGTAPGWGAGSSAGTAIPRAADAAGASRRGGVAGGDSPATLAQCHRCRS